MRISKAAQRSPAALRREAAKELAGVARSVHSPEHRGVVHVEVVVLAELLVDLVDAALRRVQQQHDES